MKAIILCKLVSEINKSQRLFRPYLITTVVMIAENLLAIRHRIII